MFDDRVYKRGALTLHALRCAVGDDTFFAILQTWVAENSGGSVTTEGFLQHAEQAAGRSLEARLPAVALRPAATRPAGADARRGSRPAPESGGRRMPRGAPRSSASATRAEVLEDCLLGDPYSRSVGRRRHGERLARGEDQLRAPVRLDGGHRLDVHADRRIGEHGDQVRTAPGQTHLDRRPRRDAATAARARPTRRRDRAARPGPRPGRARHRVSDEGLVGSTVARPPARVNGHKSHGEWSHVLSTHSASCVQHRRQGDTAPASAWAIWASCRQTRARVIPDPTKANQNGAARPQCSAITPPSP